MFRRSNTNFILFLAKRNKILKRMHTQKKVFMNMEIAIGFEVVKLG